MKRVYSHLLLLILIVCFASSSQCQRFYCDGQLFVSTYDGASTTIFRPRYIPFSQPFFSPFARYTALEIDALGFNSLDHFIYGVEQNSNAIIRLRRDNTYEQVGTVDIVPQLTSYAGDCSADGQYMCHEVSLQQLLVFEVIDQFELVRRVDLFWDPQSTNSGPFTTALFDFAIDPNNPTVAYAHQGTAQEPSLEPVSTQGMLLRINVDLSDPDVGKVTPVVDAFVPSATHFGSMLFGAASDLHGFGSTLGGFRPLESLLFSINTTSGQAFPGLQLPAPVLSSDGCSCPYSFSFSNAVPTAGFFCNNDKKTFTLSIRNNSFNQLEGITLTDTFPEGMIIDQVSNTFTGNIDASSGVGTQVLHITDLLIPAKSTIEIRVQVLSIDAAVGPTYNQAFLFNMPDRFGGTVASDDPGTGDIYGDSSYFFVEARVLEEVSWTIEPPSDCILANDGKMTLTSPQFFAGQEFEIRLRNKIGWDVTTQFVTIDANQSFTIDSLIPGDYQVFHVRSVSDNCSLAIKDTTVVVEPPNDLLTLEVGSNSPVCAGRDLELYSTINPSGGIRWTGPLLYGSETPDPIFLEAVTERSGEYKAVATYGFCTQTVFVTAEVRPQVKASISGDTSYCIRDTLQLTAKGNGASVAYSWTGPANTAGQDSLLTIPVLSDDADGQYEVIANNGACIDTATVTVTILPTPTLSLAPSITTDFCSPLILSPVLTGDTDVQLEWTPAEGLSCADCLTPEVMPLVQSSYKIQAENDFFCRDSATISVVLHKENLLYAPNIFNLSSSFGNEQFTAMPGCVVRQIHSLEVYDRWGHSAYKHFSAAPDQSLEFWNGYIAGTRASNGVYVWFAKVELVDGTFQFLSGDVTLLGQ